MVLTDLVPARSATPSLFAFDRQVTVVARDGPGEPGVRPAGGPFRVAVRVGDLMPAPTRVAFNQVPDFDPASE